MRGVPLVMSFPFTACDVVVLFVICAVAVACFFLMLATFVADVGVDVDVAVDVDIDVVSPIATDVWF